jgi:hypothetical protein
MRDEEDKSAFREDDELLQKTLPLQKSVIVDNYIPPVVNNNPKIIPQAR